MTSLLAAETCCRPHVRMWFVRRKEGQLPLDCKAAGFTVPAPCPPQATVDTFPQEQCSHKHSWWRIMRSLGSYQVCAEQLYFSDLETTSSL